MAKQPALVTGGSKGIGYAINKPLAEQEVNTPEEYYKQVLQSSEVGDSVVAAIKNPQTSTITYRKVIEF